MSKQRKATKKSLGPTGDGLFLRYGNDGSCGGLAHVFSEDCRTLSDNLGFKSLCGFRTVVINGGIESNKGREKCSDCERLVPGVVAKELARRKTAWARWITSKRRGRMIVRIMGLVEKADQSTLEAAIYELDQTRGLTP